MKTKSTPLNVKIDDLILDVKNPRFSELYSGSNKEEDLIEYLLYTEAAEEVAAAIVKADEFYPDKALWVLKNTNGTYLVKDGNRRCAAVKALQMPGKYKLSLNKTVFQELPVYLYQNQSDIDARIVEEHAGSLFRRWERIAKALEVYKLFKSGNTIDSMLEFDSHPSDLIKLASFYYEAVKIGGDDFKKLLRRGRGKDAGKTIIFERLFKYSVKCGYYFKRKPAFVIDITDKKRFDSYIKAVVDFLSETTENITTDYIDKTPSKFFDHLKKYGFDIDDNKSTQTSANGSTTGQSTGNTNPGSNSTPSATSAPVLSPSSTNNRGSVKTYPSIKRKQLPAGLKARIDEYFRTLSSSNAANSKIAMGRVLFECVMKYVVEETKYNGKTYMSKSGYFGPVYTDSKYTDFRKMKHKFIDLITSAKDRNAMLSFDLDHLHQVVHNYKVSGISTVANQVSDNLIPLIEFMLQDEADLLNSLDLTKIK